MTKKSARHRLTDVELRIFYATMCDFLEDCTRDECERYRDSILGVKTLINERIANYGND